MSQIAVFVNMNGRRERFNLCDFCEHHTGPYKEKPAQCQGCTKGNNFQKSTRLTATAEWLYKRYLKQVEELT